MDDPRSPKKPRLDSAPSNCKPPNPETSSAARLVLLEWLLDCLHDSTSGLSQKQESIRLICQLTFPTRTLVEDRVDIMKLVTEADDKLLPTYGWWLTKAPLRALEPHIEHFVDLACNTAESVSTPMRIMACDTLSALLRKQPNLFNVSRGRVFVTLRWYEEQLCRHDLVERDHQLHRHGISAVLRLMTSADLSYQAMDLMRLLHMGDGVWVSVIEYMSRRQPQSLSALRQEDLAPRRQRWSMKMMMSGLSDKAQCAYAKAVLQLMSGRQWHELPLWLEAVSHLRPPAAQWVTLFAIRCLEVRRTTKLIWDGVCRVLNGVPLEVLDKHAEEIIKVLGQHYIRYYCSGCDIADINTILSRLEGTRQMVHDHLENNAYSLVERMTMYLMLPASDLADGEILDDIITNITGGYNENKEWFLCVEVAKRVSPAVFQEKHKDSVRRKMEDVPARHAVNAMTLFPGDIARLNELAADPEVDVEIRSLALRALGFMAGADLLRGCMADKKMRDTALSMVDKISTETFQRLQHELGRYILQGKMQHTRHFTNLSTARVQLLAKPVKKYVLGKLREGSVETADPVLRLFASLPLDETRRCMRKCHISTGGCVEPQVIKTYLGAVASMPSHVLRDLEPLALEHLDDWRCRRQSTVVLLRARRIRDPRVRELVKTCFTERWMDRDEVIRCVVDSGDTSLLQEILQEYGRGAWDTDLCRTLRRQRPRSCGPVMENWNWQHMCNLEMEKWYWQHMSDLEMEACSFRYRYA